ncbi:polysaccharide pyruvyl transferase family protein [Cypionkella sp. TWP1-2-1b2]|uniref:polysaccharide pyruvyl transferase family protein n=1 Tax=Cypionkella sp. TWP1-2-1b2 TaxID=2804675 RepID=UPI003CE99325
MSDVAILRDIARTINRAIKITVMDWKDPRPPYVRGSDIRIVDLDGKTMLNPFGYFAQALRSDMVIDIGGGDSFADIYGGRRLRRMFILKYLTHLAGTPLVMAPQTIGPFTKPVSRFLARLSMRLCAVVATRDTLSTAAAREMGVTRPIIEASDVALRLQFDQPSPRAGGPVRVGLNVSGLLMGGGYTGHNEFALKSDYPVLVRDIIRFFQGRGCEVHLVPHVIVATGAMVGEDDMRASMMLAAEFPGTVLAPSFKTPSEAKSYIASMDFFLGARMHACVAAFSTGVPVVPMAYSRKFVGLFGSIGYDRTVDCTAETAAAILSKVTKAFDDRSTLATEATMALQRGTAKLAAYEDALKKLMISLR